MSGLFFSIIFISLVTVAIAGNSLAPWVPARKRDLPRIMKLAALEPGEIFYDLGCGNGRVAFYLGRHTRARIIGVELALPFYLICLLRRMFRGEHGPEFRFKSLYKEDLTGAGAVYVFAASRDRLEGGLKRKLEQELPRGARVISYAFPIMGWTPKVVDKPSAKDIAIYLYTKD